MKRFLCLVLCMLFVLSLTACGSEHDTDIKSYAKQGLIDGVDYKLGDDVDETKNALSAKYESLKNGESEFAEEDEAFYYDFESGKYTVMTDGEISCCYLTEDKDLGITHVIKVGGAYGFNIGTMSTELSDTMAEMGFDATEREAEKGELFYLPSSPNMTVLEYEVKDNTILFVFTDHALTATAIY